MRVQCGLFFVAIVVVAIVFGLLLFRPQSWQSLVLACPQSTGPGPASSLETPVSTTGPKFPPSEGTVTPTRPWSPQLSSLPTVVSDVTGPWKALNLPGKHPCLPDPSRAVISRPGVHYHSSDLEREWVTKSKHLKICSTARAPSQRADVTLWLNYSEDVFRNTYSGPYRAPGPSEAKALSAFEWGQGDIQYIEPLHGTARKPDFCDHLKEVSYNQGPAMPEIVFDIQYIIPANLCGRPGPRPRAKYYDLGATWNGQRGTSAAWANYDYRKRGAAGVISIPLFRSIYRDRCIDFDDIYAWEASQWSADEWFDPIPDELRPKVHFFNVPVSENPCPQSPSGDYKKGGSFLRFLEASAKEEDFVVVKVDTDGGPELEIMEAIAHRYELSRLVDEIYFEYHFQFDNKDFGWGRQNWQGKTIDTALSLMYRLRQAGVRSHFWI